MAQEFQPLDPDEGPTVWADTSAGNKYTIELVVGTDPENPHKRVMLSHDEVSRLEELI